MFISSSSYRLLINNQIEQLEKTVNLTNGLEMGNQVKEWGVFTQVRIPILRESNDDDKRQQGLIFLRFDRKPETRIPRTSREFEAYIPPSSSRP